MPIIKSAIKKMRQDIKRTQRNNVFRNRMKSRMKELLIGAHAKAENLEELLRTAYSSVDVALKKKLIKKNNAARKKARLARVVRLAQVKA